MRKVKGFTLVELMVTIVILAILIAIAVPSFLQTMRSNSVKTKADEATALLSYARNESVAKKRIISVNFFADRWEVIDNNQVDRILEFTDVQYSRNISSDQFSFLSNGVTGRHLNILLCKDDDLASAIYIEVERSGVITKYESGKYKDNNPITSCQL